MANGNHLYHIISSLVAEFLWLAISSPCLAGMLQFVIPLLSAPDSVFGRLALLAPRDAERAASCWFSCVF